MARILAYTSPARGHLYPLTGILLELARRGHDVAVRTLASEVPLMRSLGLEASPVAPAVEGMPLDDWRARNPRDGLVRSVSTFAARAPHDAADLRAALDAERPDAVVVDVNSWGAAAVAEAAGLPWAMFSPYPLPLPSRDAPPFGPGLPPATGPLGRLRDALLRPLVGGAHEKAILPRLNAVRADLGLPAVRSAGEIFRRPPLLLSLTGEPFEYPRSDWPESIVMVGPCDWEPPSVSPPWLEDLEGPVVLVTTSSEFQDDGRLVRVALEGLAGDFTVVATVPSGDPTDYVAHPGGPGWSGSSRTRCSWTGRSSR